MLTKDETTLFLALCKRVRQLQNLQVIHNMRDGVMLNDWELRKVFSELDREDYRHHLKKTHAVAHSLQSKGFVKISKSYKYRGKYISLDDKGVEYIKYLKGKKK